MGVAHDSTPARRAPEPARARWWMLRTLGRSPLLRFSDRAEAAVIAVAALLALVAIPVAVSAGDSVYRAELRIVQQERQSRQPTQATATADSTARTGYPGMGTVPVQWSTGAAAHDAVVSVAHPVKMWDKVEVWTDGGGELSVGPRSDADARVAGIAVALELWAMVTSAAVALVLITRLALNRSRYRGWDRAHRRLGL